MPRETEIRIINRAVLSAHLQVCGQDYLNISYLPYMSRLRDSGAYAPKQIAYLGMLHGLTVGALSRTEGQAPPDCSEPTLNALRQQAAVLDPPTG